MTKYQITVKFKNFELTNDSISTEIDVPTKGLAEFYAQGYREAVEQLSGDMGAKYIVKQIKQ